MGKKEAAMSTVFGNIGQTDKAVFITKDVSTSETPMYNPYDKNYYFVDIEYGDVHQYNPQTGVDKKWHLDKGMVGGLVVNGDGSLIVNAEEGLFAFNPADEALAKISDIQTARPGKHKMRPNDMNVIPLADGSSRVLIGCIPVDRTKVAADEKPSVTYVLDPKSLALKAIWDNHVTSNALCGYTENGENVVFYAETDKNHNPRMWRANYNAATDVLENEVLFLDRDGFQGGRPDGAHIIEVNGRKLVAVANLDTHRVVGYDVHTSEPVMSVDAPVTPDEELTLTHSVFGPDANGHTICLINSSKRKKPDGGVKLGVAVIVPIKSEFNVKSLQAVAVGYPSFDVLTENKTIEKVVAQFVSRISVSQSPSSP
jgi:sugar lactone lactonase YvrE